MTHVCKDCGEAILSIDDKPQMGEGGVSGLICPTCGELFCLNCRPAHADTCKPKVKDPDMWHIVHPPGNWVIASPNWKIELCDEGEGLDGDYDPTDPEDEHLLRFDVYTRANPYADWEEPQDTSYCTLIHADITAEERKKVLEFLMSHFDGLSYSTHVKRLCERLSWTVMLHDQPEPVCYPAKICTRKTRGIVRIFDVDTIYLSGNMVDGGD